MKIKNFARQWRVMMLMLVLVAGRLPLPTAAAQGTAFTYQGRLNINGVPANGSFDFSFAVINSGIGGLLLAGPVTNSAVNVTNGLFTTLVDLGNAFTGGSNWLEIAVSTNGAHNFSMLAPRQPLTPVPYAITAANFSGPIQPAQLPPGTITNGQTGVSLQGSFVGNGAVGQYATVAGGNGNSAGGISSTVGGGYQNQASGPGATVSGGDFNAASGGDSVVDGGSNNQANNDNAAVLGGAFGTASGQQATVLGGLGNTAAGDLSVAAGYGAAALHQGAFVWADSQLAAFASTANNQFLVRAQGGVGIGTNSPRNALSVAGGSDISASLNVGIGVAIGATPGPLARLDIFGGNDNSQGIRLHNSSVAGGHFWNIHIDANGDALVFSHDNQWPHVNYSYLSSGSAGLITTSDRRVKKDIAAMPSCLDRVLALTPATFRYREAEAGSPVNYGFIAQDVEQQFPDLVQERDGLKTLVTAGLTAINTKAIQDLDAQTQAQVRRLENENAELKQRLASLESLVRQLTPPPAK